MKNPIPTKDFKVEIDGQLISAENLVLPGDDQEFPLTEAEISSLVLLEEVEGE